ncbi:MAG: ATP phosphoribosyltransferase regulatory subunit [Eubacteriaceae bacterium]|nr:ATP phosphoribosyltransferase regulatory subunit [Eubacteriaceae bacterium]
MINYYIDGVNDIQFQELLGYERINEEIENVMRNFGYKQILTPNFEYYDMYGVDGALSRDKMFKLIDKNGKVLVLRPDATIPICRMSANNFKNPKEILKFSYITTIFRENNSKTNYRKDFIQGGIEYFGNSGPDCDAEIIAVAVTMLENLGLDKIHIDIGQVTFLESLFDGLDLDEKEKGKITGFIENKNMGDLKLYLKKLKLSDEFYEIILKIPMLFGSYESVINDAKNLCINQAMKDSLANVEAVYEILSGYGLSQYVNLDFGFTNQLNYYSGFIFKGYAEGFGEAILSGGRYDKLSSTFGVERPASGFGINISLLTELINSEDNIQDYFDLLLIYDDETITDAVKFAMELRKEDFSVDCVSSKYQIDADSYKYILSFESEGIFLVNKEFKSPATKLEVISLMKGDKKS